MNLTTTERQILASINIASENDPSRPEFPSDNPRFPATPTYQVEVPGFSDVWLKDESVNPTGTHKDRMAWEIVVTYRYFLEAKHHGQLQGQLPVMSIISSGSAALAIQSQLRKYNLPALRVLIDTRLDIQIVDQLLRVGCQLYRADLSVKALTTKEILALTENPDGFDITSSEALDPTTRFYDWLSYEILNTSPEYCFIPFGTGNLYENVLNINKKEVTTSDHDPRFQGDVATLRRCNFIGATTSNSRSKADKLYSPHLPFVHYDEQWLKLYRYAGFCGPESSVHTLEERSLDEAIDLAARQSIVCEPSGIAGLAMLLQLRDQLPKHKKMLVVNTGKSIASSGYSQEVVA